MMEYSNSQVSSTCQKQVNMPSEVLLMMDPWFALVIRSLSTMTADMVRLDLRRMAMPSSLLQVYTPLKLLTSMAIGQMMAEIMAEAWRDVADDGGEQPAEDERGAQLGGGAGGAGTPPAPRGASPAPAG